MHVAVAVIAAIVSSGTTLAFRSFAACSANKRQVENVQQQHHEAAIVSAVEATAGKILGDPQDAVLRLQQLRQERDELAQQLTYLQPNLRSVSARQPDSSNLQCLLEGLQQLHELTEQSHAITAQQVQSSTASSLISLHSAAATVAAAGDQRLAGHQGPDSVLAAEVEGLLSWGSGLRHTTSDSGAPQHCPAHTAIGGQQQPQPALTATTVEDAAATGALEGWGSGVWSRPVSTGGAAACSRLSPTCSGMGAANRLPSRLAVVSSIGAVALDSWGSGISPMHQQQQAGNAFAEEDEEAQQAQQQQQQQMAASMALVEQLQRRLAETQEQMRCLQQQVEQLQAFAQQQEEQLAYSEEIISRMQSLASCLDTIRRSRESSSA